MSRALESLLRFVPSDSSSWIDPLRREALASFEAQGLPTRRLENWKGTSLAPLEKLEFTRVGPGQRPIEPDPTAPGLVFVDGRFDPKASRPADLPAGIRISSLAEALERDPELLKGRLGSLADAKRHGLVALQTAFLEDGAVVSIDAGARTQEPLRMRFLSTSDGEEASAGFPRLLVVAGENSETTLLQEHVSIGAAIGFTAFVAELHLAPGARIDSLEIQAEAAERIHFTSLHARLERDARLDSRVFTLGNGLVRSEVEVELAEPGAEVRLEGLFVGRDDAHIDHFTTVDHAAERCTSDEEYRGVLGDRSEGVFRGRVIVRPGAQGTDARQSNPNLLLSDAASIDAKPQLEIYADDVRASHGSTIGQLDADAVFFLRARGIDEHDARLLLTSAFAREIVDRIADETLRAHVGARVEATLAGLERHPGDATRGRAMEPNR